MIASPGNVSKERGIVREVLHDWNDVNSTSSKVVLSQVGWDSHSSPELGASPQELINTRLLKDCDLLVAYFGPDWELRQKILQVELLKKLKSISKKENPQ